LVFPPPFLFGAATSAYQIEGAASKDGRGVSIWDEFCRTGKTRHGETGDVACDHYHRFAQDVALLKKLNLQAYRFSIAWPRVVPDGTGTVNQRGLDFYKRLLDELLEAEIVPFVTLFHWDMPVSLLRRYGGFLDRRAATDFADYAEVVVRALGDRVRHWITINEPFEHAFLGYCMGVHAPGIRRPWSYLQVIHHQLLAHGMAVERIRGLRSSAKVGIAVSLTPIHPSPTGDPEKNRRAAQTANELINFATLDPLLRGHYPDDLWRRLRWFRPKIALRDLQSIRATMDFIGINNYQREFATHRPWIPFLQGWVAGGTDIASGQRSRGTGQGETQYTSMGWEVYPPALHEVLTWLRRDYDNPPVYITENGAAFDDQAVEGVVHDPQRMAFLAGHLTEVQRAITEGADVRGYFAWSAFDNFEWAAGYAARFGLIHVDFATQVRTIKNSGYWYAELIRAQVELRHPTYGSARGR
jgi:beta-glucosidase